MRFLPEKKRISCTPGCYNWNLSTKNLKFLHRRIHRTGMLQLFLNMHNHKLIQNLALFYSFIETSKKFITRSRHLLIPLNFHKRAHHILTGTKLPWNNRFTKFLIFQLSLVNLKMNLKILSRVQLLDRCIKIDKISGFWNWGFQIFG